MFYLVKTPPILKKLYPDCLWNVKTMDKVLYITFDDGPHPEITPFVLNELKKYNAKATFFCVCKNVKENFDVYKQMIADGHTPGNHTYNHLNGWKTSDEAYLNDIKLAEKIIDSDLFRPPFGKITKFQIRALKGEAYRLKTVMWDVISGDFDEKLSAENCLLNVTRHSTPGSIIVLHDSMKAFPRLQYTLPRVLDFFAKKNYAFKSLTNIL